MPACTSVTPRGAVRLVGSILAAPVFFAAAPGAHATAGSLEEGGDTVRAGAKDITAKAMAYAEKNVQASLDYAQSLLHAKDLTQVMRLHGDYVQSQMRALTEQASEMGQIVGRAAMMPPNPGREFQSRGSAAVTFSAVDQARVSAEYPDTALLVQQPKIYASGACTPSLVCGIAHKKTLRCTKMTLIVCTGCVPARVTPLRVPVSRRRHPGCPALKGSHRPASIPIVKGYMP